MKTVYAISRWSNASRAAARHIDNGEGKPLCGGAGRKAFSWEREDGEPTCKHCIRLSAKRERQFVQVTRDMAIDAGDRSLEGEWVEW